MPRIGPLFGVMKYASSLFQCIQTLHPGCETQPSARTVGFELELNLVTAVSWCEIHSKISWIDDSLQSIDDIRRRRIRALHHALHILAGLRRDIDPQFRGIGQELAVAQHGIERVAQRADLP